MLGGERQIVTRVQEHVYCRRQGAASAMAQRNDKLEAATEVLDRIPQASEYFCAEAVARNAHYEQIVRPFIKNEFYWHTCIRAAQNSREGPLLRHCASARCEAQITQINRDDLLYAMS